MTGSLYFLSVKWPLAKGEHPRFEDFQGVSSLGFGEGDWAACAPDHLSEATCPIGYLRPSAARWSTR